MEAQKPGRAWIEISESAIINNYHLLCKAAPRGEKIMAVVKADAYGHGAERVAKILSKEGCLSFAVATMEEGIRLRNAGIGGDILILGYTMPRDAFLLNHYDLIQTITDENHAKALGKTGYPLRCHLAVDTGMNRLGIPCKCVEDVFRVLEMDRIRIEGIYSHLSVADSRKDGDIKFTQKQITEFLKLKDEMQNAGYRDLVFHMQSSYGFLYYPMTDMGYARIGIALYGCTSNAKEEKYPLPLVPALSLKSRIGCIRTVHAGEYVSYGRSYEAKTERKAAAVTIGYADGLPRSLSGKCFAIVKGKKVPVMGRICMDQLMLDVTDIEDVKEGDIVTFIGNDGQETILAADVADAAGTITNEFLSRLGSRLTRIYLA